MVVLKSSEAVGSFLGWGTHVWLEIHGEDGVKTTYSGSKQGDLLGVLKNYKRDYDREPLRGQIVIDPPEGVAPLCWAKRVILAADQVMNRRHRQLFFNGFFPYLHSNGNCCTIAHEIIYRAGGRIPCRPLKGFTPGLKCKGIVRRVRLLTLYE